MATAVPLTFNGFWPLGVAAPGGRVFKNGTTIGKDTAILTDLFHPRATRSCDCAYNRALSDKAARLSPERPRRGGLPVVRSFYSKGGHPWSPSTPHSANPPIASTTRTTTRERSFTLSCIPSHASIK